MTGPILPFFVESKVEQYLKIIFLHFLDFNHSKALILSKIAFFIGTVLVLRAITTALSVSYTHLTLPTIRSG